MNKIPFLIHCLRPESTIPKDPMKQRQLLRASMNQHDPNNTIPDKYWAIQDELLQKEIQQKGIVSLNDLSPIKPQIYLWQGDITRLKVDAIVNAANSQLLGCFNPRCICIDNVIHSAAGLQLRQACFELINKQGKLEDTGKAKITPAFNLTSKFVIHTVGPIVNKNVSEIERNLLANCYSSCLELAKNNNLKSVAFCCISTGAFHFPNKEAAKIAINTVQNFLEKNPEMNVIFNVFKNTDLAIYEHLLLQRKEKFFILSSSFSCKKIYNHLISILKK